MYKHNKISVGLDEVAVIPESPVVFSDSEVDLSINIGNLNLSLPIISAAMDSVFSIEMANILSNFGGFSLLNLCGLVSRYKFSEFNLLFKVLLEKPEISTLQNVYNKPIDYTILDENLIEIRKSVKCNFGVAATPQTAERIFEIALNHGINVFAIQSSFVSPFWKSKKFVGLDIIKYLNQLQSKNCTVMVGNVASLNVARVFVDGGIDAIILGIGPGAICTTRTVLGIGAGHISSIAEIREYIETSSSKTRIIADGGIQNSGDIVKLLCTGAHAVILGNMFAKTQQAPFIGMHWGMSAPERKLPRGNLQLFKVNESNTIEKVLNGPSDVDNGIFNVIHALKNAFSNIGVLNIDDSYHKTSVLRFSGMTTEGKIKR